VPRFGATAAQKRDEFYRCLRKLLVINVLTGKNYLKKNVVTL
jgi:hypothetical protein